MGAGVTPQRLAAGVTEGDAAIDRLSCLIHAAIDALPQEGMARDVESLDQRASWSGAFARATSWSWPAVPARSR
jgi:hypothetical protein